MASHYTDRVFVVETLNCNVIIGIMVLKFSNTETARTRDTTTVEVIQIQQGYNTINLSVFKKSLTVKIKD
jgi:hypothetical protein